MFFVVVGTIQDVKKNAKNASKKDPTIKNCLAKCQQKLLKLTGIPIYTSKYYLSNRLLGSTKKDAHPVNVSHS